MCLKMVQVKINIFRTLRLLINKNQVDPLQVFFFYNFTDFLSQEVDTRQWWQKDGEHVKEYRDSLTDEEVLACCSIIMQALAPHGT